jgi:tetratricopeptide (TPR) repeat protein
MMFPFLLFLALPSGDFAKGTETLKRNDYDTAVASFNRCIQQNPRNAAAYVKRGIAYVEKGDLSKALGDFTEAIRLDPKNAEGLQAAPVIIGTLPEDIRPGKAPSRLGAIGAVRVQGKRGAAYRDDVRGGCRIIVGAEAKWSPFV